VPIVVRSWVGVYEGVALRIAERILDRGLVGGILEFVQLVFSEHARIRRVAHGSWRIGGLIG